MTDYRVNVILDPTKAVAGAKKIGKAVDGIEKEAKQASNEVREIGKAASGVKSLLAQVFSVAALVASVNLLKNYSQEMSTVRAITQATEAQFQQLNATAQQLGSSTVFSATEVAQGMQFLAKAGFDTNQVLKAIPGTLLLAQTGALELASAADIMSNVLTGMSLAVEDSNRVVDVLAFTANNANTNVQQLGDAFKFVAPVASGFGVSLEATAAAIGKLSDSGLQASTAGTGLRKTLTSLVNPTSATLGVMRELGLAMDQVDPNVVGLQGSLDALGEAGLTVGQALIVAGDRGGPALAKLVENRDGIREFTAELEKSVGFAQRMADVMNDNLNGSLRGLRSAIEGLVLAMGESGLTAAIRLVVDTFTFLFRAITPLAPLITGMGAAFALVASTILPSVIAGMYSAVASMGAFFTATTAATGSAGLFATALRAIGLAVVSSPLGLMGTILLGVGIAIAQTTGLFTGLFNVLTALSNLLVGTFNVVVTSLQQTFQMLGINLSESTIQFGLLGGALLALVPVLGQTAIAMVSQLIPAITATLTQLRTLIVTGVTAAATSFRALASAMSDPRILLLGAALTLLAGTVVILTGNTEELTKVYKEFKEALFGTAEATEEITDEMIDMKKRVDQAKQSIIDGRKNAQAYAIALEEVGGETAQVVGTTSQMNAQLQQTAPLAQSSGDGMTKLADGTEKFVKSGKDAEGVASKLVDIMSKMEGTIERVADSWTNLAQEIRAAAKSAQSSGISAGSTVGPGTVSTTEQICIKCGCGGGSDSQGADDTHPGGSSAPTSSGSSSGGSRSSGGGQTFTSSRGQTVLGGGAFDGLDTIVESLFRETNSGAQAAAEQSARVQFGIVQLQDQINSQLSSGAISASQAASTFTQGLDLIKRGIEDPTIVAKLQAAGETVFSNIIQSAINASVDASEFLTSGKVRVQPDAGTALGGTGKDKLTNDFISDLFSVTDLDSSNPFEFLSLFADDVAAASEGVSSLTKSLGAGGGGFTSAIERNTQAILDNTDRYTLAEKNVSSQYRAGLPLATALSPDYGTGSSVFDDQNFGLPGARGSGSSALNVNGVTIYANDSAGGKQAAIAFNNELSRQARRGSRRTN